MSFGKSAEIYIFHKTTNEMHAGCSLQRDSENRNAQMQIFPDYHRIKFLHLVSGSFHCEAQLLLASIKDWSSSLNCHLNDYFSFIKEASEAQKNKTLAPVQGVFGKSRVMI